MVLYPLIVPLGSFNSVSLSFESNFCACELRPITSVVRIQNCLILIMPSNILITGGTGLVGSELIKALSKKKYGIKILTTSAVRAERDDAFYWNLKDQYIDYNAFEDVDAIVHLAGAGVADKKWTKERKQLIYDSRVRNTELLFDRAKGHGIKTMVAATAIGYYGLDAGDQSLNENSKRGNDFFSEVVGDWEEAIDLFNDEFERVVKLRIGVVLSPKGGALPKITKPIKFWVGAPLGSGRQWMSWIHMDDLIKMILFALETESSGTYNAVAPNPVTNSQFTTAVAKQMKKPLWLPNIPPFVLKMVFGELAQVILGGLRVESAKIEKKNFRFDYPELDGALTDLLK